MIAVSNVYRRSFAPRRPCRQPALVVAGAGIATRGAALIPLRIAQPIRLGVEQSVQRLLHSAPHHPVEVALDPLVVNRDDIVQRTRCIV
jgi:hypothetical protein